MDSPPAKRQKMASGMDVDMLVDEVKEIQEDIKQKKLDIEVRTLSRV